MDCTPPQPSIPALLKMSYHLLAGLNQIALPQPIPLHFVPRHDSLRLSTYYRHSLLTFWYKEWYKMKAVDRHLYSRDNYLYYRYTLPKPLHTVFPHKEIKISLSTKDVALARLYVAKLDIEIQSLISQTYAEQDIETARNCIMQGIEGMKGKVEGWFYWCAVQVQRSGNC